MKLTYTKQGDYLIPDITIRQSRKALGHYGRLRKTYLQNFRPILFNELVLSDMLFEILHPLSIPAVTNIKKPIILNIYILRIIYIMNFPGSIPVFEYNYIFKRFGI